MTLTLWTLPKKFFDLTRDTPYRAEHWSNYRGPLEPHKVVQVHTRHHAPRLRLVHSQR